MDIFRQNKLLIRVVVALVAMNVLLIGLFISKEFFFKKKRHSEMVSDSKQNDKKDVSAALKEELGLTVEQVEQIKKLRADFFEKEKDLSAVIRSKRDSMNLLMFNKTTNENLVKQLAQSVADNEYQMELLRFEQSKAFKQICTLEQLEKFEGLVKEIKDYFKPDKPRKNKEPLRN
jgi:Spy/CpxP family protein refolding chaperone